jgi:hypothetical protein
MNKQTWLILIVGLGMIGGAATLLAILPSQQRLGQPAVRALSIPGSPRLQVELPERALEYSSKPVEMDDTTLQWLPQDTSFGQRVYRAPDGFEVSVAVVLMGSDRTSLHKAEFCLEGQGWLIDRGVSHATTVRVDRPLPYELPVMKFIATRQVAEGGRNFTARGVYVAWFVADGELTAQHWQRMWWMARDLLRTGVLQRWAMISYFTVCEPGQEDVAFERMKKLINASVPEFQLFPRPVGQMSTARP